jgi:putative two-component system response regulator
MRTYPAEIKDKELIDSIRRMAQMAEYREPETTSHRERIREYCYVLGICIGLSAYDAEVISFACMLHDIGKVGLPESLIMKAGDLTSYEWEQMKKHTTIGAEILRGSPSVILQTGEVVALTHHERWDGSGYPNALRGEDIPLSGRICALADVFDALTTKRLYKQEVSVDNAFRLIKDAGGQLFDPKLVEVFLQNREDIQKIRNIGAASS